MYSYSVQIHNCVSPVVELQSTARANGKTLRLVKLVITPVLGTGELWGGARIVDHGGVEQWSARVPHKHEVAGSSPAPATSAFIQVV